MTATPAQISCLWSLARQRGLDADELRAMTPHGSVRSLTIAEASALIDRLKGHQSPSREGGGSLPRPRAIPGIARQPAIEQLILDGSLVRWIAQRYHKTIKEVEAWLATRHYRSHGGPMNLIRTSADCVERIELLKAVKAKAERAARDPQRQLFVESDTEVPAHVAAPAR